MPQHKHLLTILVVGFLAFVFLFPVPASARTNILRLETTPPSQAVLPDTIRAGKYDNGKMWAFEYPPLEYLAETYDFHPDDSWFERARLSVLRIPGCSASFISGHGLVVTNHHCVRARVSQLSRDGENLLDDGFYATSLDEERRIPNYYADQLIAIEDVTDTVDQAVAGIEEDAARAEARSAVIDRITERIRSERTDVPGLQVQIIALYGGGRYSAYIFRRYSDVRLVMAVELQAGFFGGDGDNFTYPRYALDYAFLRIYGDNGKPVESPQHFGFSDAGVEEGDLIFVIGNPGSTSRQATVSQLEFFRDVLVDHTLRMVNDRLDAFRAFYAEDPVRGEQMNLRNTIFSISNTQKAYTGRDEALKDPYLIARRADAERRFRKSIRNDPRLAARFADVFDRIAEVQEAKRAYADAYGSFRAIESSLFSSSIIRRAIQAVRYMRTDIGDTSAVSSVRTRLLQVADRPVGLEKRLIEARLGEFRLYFGAESEIMSSVLSGRTAGEIAEQLVTSSILATEEQTRAALAADSLAADDPAIRLAAAFMDAYDDYRGGYGRLMARERELQGIVGRARFAVYGVSVPSDATFSPRFTDGIVKGYPYNGTLAPPYTTLYGMLDHYFSYEGNPDWVLPPRLANPPADLDLSTPLDFISTSDTIGGNSGSPAVTRELNIVGLNFDRNIEGLSRDYIYLPERGRNIMVDMRAVKETLDKVYDADRIVLELTTGQMVATEADADAVSSR